MVLCNPSRSDGPCGTEAEQQEDKRLCADVSDTRILEV
jgi:hypothetical protein